MQIELSLEEPVRDPRRPLYDPVPAHLRVDGDSKGGQCWIWLMFFLAGERDEPGSGGADEPWVKVSLGETRRLRDRLDELVRRYGG